MSAVILSKSDNYSEPCLGQRGGGMHNLIQLIGNSAGILGIVICLVTGIMRLSGHPVVFGFEAITLFIGGIALMVMACLAKLESQQK
jgi:type IV secretory pathway VirB2 component (pilin)